MLGGMQQPMPPNHPPNLPPAPGWPIHPAMVTVAFEIPAFKIVRNLGVVRGIVVRSPGFAGGIAAGFEALGGGNVSTLTSMCDRARSDAYMQLLQHAAQAGANGIIGVRYDATELGQGGLTEVLAYGTAVWADPVT